MKIALGADHGGYDLKTQIAGWLKEAGHEVLDLGAPDYNRFDDYADFAFAVGEAVASGQAKRLGVPTGARRSHQGRPSVWPRREALAWR